MRLKELRRSQGMTQESVAESIGLPVATYRNYERGNRQAPRDVLFSLADLYNVSLDYIMGRDMSSDEQGKAQLVALYDMLNDEGKSLLVKLARMTVKSGEYLSI